MQETDGGDALPFCVRDYSSHGVQPLCSLIQLGPGSGRNPLSTESICLLAVLVDTPFRLAWEFMPLRVLGSSIPRQCTSKSSQSDREYLQHMNIKPSWSHRPRQRFSSS